MEISNIRIEDREDGRSYLTVDMKCGFSNARQMWFSVDEKYRQWLTDDVYDAFLVAAVWPCMCYGEDIVIKGSVSKKLYKNISDYVLPLIKTLRPKYKDIKIHCESFKDAEKASLNIVGTGFSGGVDSFCTLIDKFENESDPEYRINTLFFFNLGQYGVIGDPKTKENVLHHYNISNEYAKEVNLPFVLLDSNMFEFYKPEWEYDAGPLCRISAILAFQRALIRYYVSGSYHYMQLCDFKSFYHLDDVADPFIYIMLSPNNLDIVLDGSQYYRSDKTVKVASYAPATRHLNVCVNSNIDILVEKNCSICHKCSRTLVILEAIGKLGDFSKVFDIKKYRKNSFSIKCQNLVTYKSNPFSRDITDYARSHGVKYPPMAIAQLYVFGTRVVNKLRRIVGR